MRQPHSGPVTSTRTVDAGLLGVAVVWGSSYLVAKDLTALAPVLVVLALRYLLTTAALGVVCALARPTRPGRHELAVGALLGVTQLAVLALETFGVAHTSATNAGLIISLTVVLTPVLDSAWSRTWLPPGFFVAATVAVVGVGLLVGGDGFRAPTGGDALVLAAAGVRALHVTLLGRLTTSARTSPLTLTTIQSVVGTVLLLAVATTAVGATVGTLPASAWAQLLYLSLACTVAAFLVQTWGIRRTSPSRASLLMGTEPVWAVAIGLGIAGDRIGLLGTLGVALVLAATYGGQLVETRHRSKTSALVTA